MEAFMYGPPAYVWAMIIAGLTAIGAMACITLYGGAMRAGLGRGRAALLAGAMAGPARRLVHRYRGDRGSGLVPHAAVVPGRGGRVPGHAAGTPGKGDEGWLTSTACMAACSRPTRLATPRPWLRWRGRCMASWPRRPQIWARCGPGSGFMRPRRTPAAGGRPHGQPGPAPARRLRSRTARHTGDVIGDGEADRGGTGAGGHRGTTSTMCPAVRERPGHRCLPAAGIGRIPAVSSGTPSAAVSCEPRF